MPTAKLSTFLFLMARQVRLDALRSETRRANREERWGKEQPQTQAAPRAGEREDVRWAVARLSEPLREVVEVNKMALPPCHTMFQFYVANGKLSLQLYQRSADLFLGVPFNIASYALLLMMVAKVCGLEPGEFIHTFGDAHIYLNHFEQVKLQLTREPRPLPRMVINRDVTDIFDFKYEDFTIEGYDPYPLIKGVVSV